MALKIARLSIKYDPAKTQEAVLDEALAKAGLTRADIDVDFQTDGQRDDWGLKTHFGNWLLVPVLDNEASAKLAAVMGTALDNHDEIFEESDLAKFKVGDKVTLAFGSEFGFPVKGEGTVHAIVEHGLTIKKKGSRTKGWSVRVGDWKRLAKIEAPGRAREKRGDPSIFMYRK